MKGAIKLYDKLLAGHPNMDRKGKTMPYTSVNGHMYSFVSKDGTMALRLSPKDRASFIQKYNVQLMEQHGRIMKEYVPIPKLLLENTVQLSSYLEHSFNYVSTLNPK